jgi:hypothetical protein
MLKEHQILASLALLQNPLLWAMRIVKSSSQWEDLTLSGSAEAPPLRAVTSMKLIIKELTSMTNLRLIYLKLSWIMVLEDLRTPGFSSNVRASLTSEHQDLAAMQEHHQPFFTAGFLCSV